MDSIPEEVLAYSASCNPPRRAKRARTTSIANPSADKPKPVLAPVPGPAMRPRTTSGTAADTEEDAPENPAPKRRGRKPSTLSRAARESMRRENHSRIEKARRTKINDALATLRDLVPSDTKVEPVEEESDEDDDEYEEAKKQGKPKPKQEKEFKLEILIKTVTYVQELKEKVRKLEERGCLRCAGEDASVSRQPPRNKRKFAGDSGIRQDAQDMDLDSLILPQSAHAALQSSREEDDGKTQKHAMNLNRLPSISSWLPNAHLSPSLLPADSQVDPQRPGNVQLLTPPTSATLQPIASPQIPPALSLDLPAPNALAQSFTSVMRSHAQSLQSPPWTPEDESAASLLLQIRTSTSPTMPKSKFGGSFGRSDGGSGYGLGHADVPRVQTPASLLGMKLDARK